MGIFSSLFGKKSFAEHKAKADRYWQDGEFGLARTTYEAALKRFDERVDDVRQRDAAAARVAEAGDRIARESLETVKAYMAADKLEEAEDQLRHAIELAVDEGLRAELDATMKELDELFEGGPGEVGSTLLLDETDIAFEDLYDQYLLALPDAQSRVYRTLGEDFARGFVSLHGGDGETAVGHLEKAVAERADSPFVQRELGRAYLYVNRAADAVEPLRAYHEAAPEDPSGVRDLAHALQLSERWSEALELLLADVERRPESPRALLVVAEHHLLRSEWDEATRAAIDALGLTEAPGGALGGARSALRSGSGEGAMRRSAQEAGVDEGPPPRINLYRTLGQAHAGAGRFDDAIDAFENVLKEHWRYDPETETISFDRESGWLLANLYLEQNRRHDRAIEILHAMLTGSSGAEQVAVLVRLAQAQQSKGRRREAAEMVARARALVDPEDTETLSKLDELSGA